MSRHRSAWSLHAIVCMYVSPPGRCMAFRWSSCRGEQGPLLLPCKRHDMRYGGAGQMLHSFTDTWLDGGGRQ